MKPRSKFPPVHGSRTNAAKPAARSEAPVDVDPGAAFCAAATAALRRGEPEAVSDNTLRRVLTVAVKLYAAKCERSEQEFAPFEDNAVTATETVMASCAMIRAANLNLFDVAMWFRRAPNL